MINDIAYIFDALVTSYQLDQYNKMLYITTSQRYSCIYCIVVVVVGGNGHATASRCYLATKTPLTEKPMHLQIFSVTMSRSY